MVAIAPNPNTNKPVITWEKLPDGYPIPDDPVDNINQPPIAAALTDSLNQSGHLTPPALATTDYGLCATVNGKTILKAPDWSFIPRITVDRAEVFLSYTPHLQGEVPTIVLEVLSKTDGGEYSTSLDPMGKWSFSERILKVPYYAIFEPDNGDLEVYVLEGDRYRRHRINDQGHYWVEPMQLALGAWYGLREGRTGYWPRWWDKTGNCLPWANE
jgi:Uma2 family endonuclease